MIGAWMLYCLGTSALLALSALMLERGLRLRGAPVRWVWVGALLGSLSLAALPWISPPRSDGGAVGRSVGTAGGPGGAAWGEWIATSTESTPPEPPLFPSLTRLDAPLLLLWTLLSAAGFLFLLATHGKLARRRRKWRRAVVDDVSVLVSRDVGPAVIGFLDAAIVIPEWVLGMDATKRQMVLSHEEEHRRARDAWLLALALASVALVPWNAPLWWQARRLRHAVEMDCDARVVRRCSDVRGYSALLIEVGERIAMPAVAFAAFSESTSFLERRIRTMITLRTRRWKVALSGSVVVGVGLLVLACEAPIPTMPSAAKEPEATAKLAPQLPPEDAVIDSPEAPAVEARQSRSDSDEIARASRPDEQSVSTGSQIARLVQRLQPETYATGLSLDRAVWIVVDRDGMVQKSWIGPNLFINMTDGPRPNRAARFPVGSPEWSRAFAELERAGKEELRAHVPAMTVRGGNFAVWYHLGPANKMMVVHLVSETAGMLGTRPLAFNW